MRAAIVQVASPTDEPAHQRRDRVRALIASAGGADLIVLPELWPGGYFAFKRYEADAEGERSETMRGCRDLARALGCFIQVGSYIRRGPTGRLYNTSALIDPRGRAVLTYDKMHTFGYQSDESRLITPGRQIATADTSIGRLALATCYDLRFPGFWDQVGRLLPDVIVVSAAWPLARLPHWELLTSARALEAQAFLIGCNAVGQQHGVVLAGHSRVVDPWGHAVHQASQDEGVTFCEVDVARAQAFRAEFPVHADRLPSYARAHTLTQEV